MRVVPPPRLRVLRTVVPTSSVIVLAIMAGGCGTSETDRSERSPELAPIEIPDSAIELEDGAKLIVGPMNGNTKPPVIRVGDHFVPRPGDVVVIDTFGRRCGSARIAGIASDAREDDTGCRLTFVSGQMIWTGLQDDIVYHLGQSMKWSFEEHDDPNTPSYVGEQCGHIVETDHGDFVVGRAGKAWSCDEAFAAMERFLTRGTGPCFHEGDEYWCESIGGEGVVGTAVRIPDLPQRLDSERTRRVERCGLAARVSASNVFARGVPCEEARIVALHQTAVYGVTSRTHAAGDWTCRRTAEGGPNPPWSVCTERDECDDDTPFVLLDHTGYSDFDGAPALAEPVVKFGHDREGNFYYAMEGLPCSAKGDGNRAGEPVAAEKGPARGRGDRCGETDPTGHSDWSFSGTYLGPEQIMIPDSRQIHPWLTSGMRFKVTKVLKGEVPAEAVVFDSEVHGIDPGLSLSGPLVIEEGEAITLAGQGGLWMSIQGECAIVP